MPVLTGVNTEQDYAVISSEYMQLQYKSGTTWYNIHGITDFSVSGGQAPTRDITPANGGVGKRAGRPRVPDVTFQAYQIPNDKHWRALRDFHAEGGVVQFRIRTDGERTYLAEATNGAKFTVTDTGLVTFTDTAGNQPKPNFESTTMGIGSIIHTAAKNYVMSDITNAGAINVLDIEDYENPAEVTTGTQFAIYSPAPQEYWFSANVTNVTDASLSAEGELMTPLTLSLRKPFPKPTILTSTMNLTP